MTKKLAQPGQLLLLQNPYSKNPWKGVFPSDFINSVSVIVSSGIGMPSVSGFALNKSSNTPLQHVFTKEELILELHNMKVFLGRPFRSIYGYGREVLSKDYLFVVYEHPTIRLKGSRKVSENIFISRYSENTKEIEAYVKMGLFSEYNLKFVHGMFEIRQADKDLFLQIDPEKNHISLRELIFEHSDYKCEAMVNRMLEFTYDTEWPRYLNSGLTIAQLTSRAFCKKYLS